MDFILIHTWSLISSGTLISTRYVGLGENLTTEIKQIVCERRHLKHPTQQCCHRELWVKGAQEQTMERACNQRGCCLASGESWEGGATQTQQCPLLLATMESAVSCAVWDWRAGGCIGTLVSVMKPQKWVC